MRSIHHRFEALQEKEPYRSSYINFSMAVKGQKYNSERLRIAFNSLVDKADYSAKDKQALLQRLYSHTNCAEAYWIRGEKAPQTKEKAKVLSGGV